MATMWWELTAGRIQLLFWLADFLIHLEKFALHFLHTRVLPMIRSLCVCLCSRLFIFSYL